MYKKLEIEIGIKKEIKKIDIYFGIFKEEDIWISQGINYDIASQGKTEQESIASFEHVVKGQIILDIEDGKEPLETTPQYTAFFPGGLPSGTIC